MENLIKEILSSNAEELMKDKSLIYDFFNAANTKRKYIFGINEYSRALAKVYEIDGFIDDFTKNLEIDGIPIFKTKEIDNDAIVVNCTFSISPVSVEKKLKAIFECYLNYFQLANSLHYLTPLNRKIQQQNFDFYKNFEQYKNVFEALEDDKSKTTYIDLLKYRLTGNIQYMYDYSIRPNEQYFEDFIKLPSNAVFIDGGGYDGDSSELFCKFCPDYGKVYLFEPDRNNISKAKIRLTNTANIVFIEKALSNNEGFINFSPTNNMVSKVSDIGDQIIVTTIDSEIKDKIDFIKLDLEGFDLLAIKGSVNHILNDYPTMAIAVYHEISHIHEIFNFVMKLQPNYRLRIRHYTEGDSETIMYFIPQND
jgi:FkbM family methyltransferase